LNGRSALSLVFQTKASRDFPTIRRLDIPEKNNKTQKYSDIKRDRSI